MIEQKKSLEPVAAGIKAQYQCSVEDHTSTAAPLHIVYIVETHFNGEPELAYRWLVDQYAADTEPGISEPLNDWLSRLTATEIRALEGLS